MARSRVEGYGPVTGSPVKKNCQWTEEQQSRELEKQITQGSLPS